MMNLILGRAGSGKSEACLARIERLARAGGRSILVVPEQSSYSFERALTLRLEGRAAGLCAIRSFKRLCGDIFAECGGGAKKRVSDAEKCAVLRRALAALEGELTLYRRHRRDRAFFTLAVSVIDELKNGGVTPAQMREAAGRAANPLSRDRLSELALIYEGYEAMLAQQYVDDAGELLAAARLCAGAKQFADVTLFFDGYSGFTYPEFELIGALLSLAKEVVVTLCCDGDIYAERQDAFSAVRDTARRLRALADRRQAGFARPVVLEEAPRFRAPMLAQAERFYADGTLPQAPDPAGGVYEIAGADLYGEAELAAREILTLVREDGYRFADIAVVARDAERYRFAVERTFARYGIPLFSDSPGNMLHTAFSAFVLGALALAEGMRTDAVFRVLKTGLCALEEQAVSELENYCFVWNIEGGGWLEPFTRRPDGFGEPDAETAAQTARVEAARATAAGWFCPFIKQAQAGGAQALVEAVWALMERCGAVKALAQADDGDARRQAALGIGLLDRLHDLVGQEHYTPAELSDLYTLLAGETPVGEIPQSLEQVAFGSADRMRTQNPRAVFVLGLNDGIFPKTGFEAPLLSFEERELLCASGASLSRDFETSAAMERLYLYRAATAARDRLYLCRACADQRGTGLLPEPQTALFCAAAGARRPESEAAPLPGAQTPRAAAYAYASAAALGERAACAAIAQSGLGGSCAAIDSAAAAPSFAARNTELAAALMGETATLSATRIETYENCAFRYFLQYMLRVRPLERAELNPAQAGTFVHAVLENVLAEFGGELAAADEQALREAAARQARAYAEAQFAQRMNQPRMQYLAGRLEAQTIRLVLQLRREQAQSAFRPADFELEIGRGRAIEPLALRVPGGGTVYVEGKIDRVDLFQKDGKSYIRVVDYKTGDKAFSLTDVYYGLNMQMLLYLFTVCKNGGARYKNPVPAAVMYLPADPTPPAGGDDPEKAARRAYRMDGLVLDDPEIAAAMEQELAGVFIPVTGDSRGGLRRSEKLASLEKLGRIEAHVEKTVGEMAAALYAGSWEAVPARPGARESACDFCPYAAVCRRDRGERERVFEKREDKRPFEPDGKGADA